MAFRALDLRPYGCFPYAWISCVGCTSRHTQPLIYGYLLALQWFPSLGRPGQPGCGCGESCLATIGLFLSMTARKHAVLLLGFYILSLGKFHPCSFSAHTTIARGLDHCCRKGGHPILWTSHFPGFRASIFGPLCTVVVDS